MSNKQSFSGNGPELSAKVFLKCSYTVINSTHETKTTKNYIKAINMTKEQSKVHTYGAERLK